MFYEQQTFHVVFCPYWCEKGGKMHGFEKKLGLEALYFMEKLYLCARCHEMAAYFKPIKTIFLHGNKNQIAASRP